MPDEQPPAPETTDLGALLDWLRSAAPAGTTDDLLVGHLATGLYYEAQSALKPISPPEDPDFYSEAAGRSPGETELAWAQRTVTGLNQHFPPLEVQAIVARAAQRAYASVASPGV